MDVAAIVEELARKRVTLVRSADVALIWPSIEAGVLDVEATRPTRGAQLRDALMAGRAYLFLVDSGFFVLAPSHNEETAAAEIMIWIARATGAGNMRCYLPTIVEFAGRMGVRAVTVRSSRLGMRRALGPGWKPRFTEYALEIPPWA